MTYKMEGRQPNPVKNGTELYADMVIGRVKLYSIHRKNW